MKNTILLVEDNEDDAFLMQRAMAEAQIVNPLQHVEDGQAAIDYLRGSGDYSDRDRFPLPMIVFLDLKLPLKNGHEVLAWIRGQPEFADLVVIVLTSSEEQVDIKRSYQLGANSYVVKPPTAEDLSKTAKAFNLWWLNENRVSERPC